MDWKDIAGIVGKAAPLLGGALLGPAGAVGGKLIAAALGVDEAPDKVAAALQADPQAAIKLAEIEANNKTQLQRMTLEAETARLAEVNATIRAEVASGDGYVRRMRPTFGYVLAATVALEAVLAALVALFQADRLADLAVVYDALATPQAVALAALGVYMKKRSDEKTTGIGGGGPGLLSGLFK